MARKLKRGLTHFDVDQAFIQSELDTDFFSYDLPLVVGGYGVR